MNTDTTVTRPRKVSRVFAAGLGIVFAIAGAAVTFADANETGQSSPLAHVQSSVALGSNHSCALMSTATIKCWGSNTFGQLGTGNTASSNTPIDVITLTNVTAISAGELHTCALLATGKVNCWGSREDGRLGIGGDRKSVV